MEHNTDFSQRNVKAGWHFSRMVRLITGLICAAIVYPATACATDIADYPLELVSMAAPPVVMVVLDDSSSMDLEFITPENDGTFNGNYYVFPENPGDNVFTTPVTYMTEDERKSWKSQWHGYNSLYYNPKTRYVPWPDPNGVGLLPAADTARPRSNPMTPSPTLALDGVYLTVPVQGPGNPEIIRNAHYYILDDRNSNGLEDPGEALFLISMSRENRDIYRVSDNDNDGRIDGGELIKATLSQIPETLRPSPVLSEDLSNFANWYSYYRRRSLAAKAAVGRVISDLSGIRLGLYSINRNLVQDALPVRVTGKDGQVRDKSPDLLSRLYRLKSQGTTPLREGLNTVGRYYQGLKPGGLGPSPYALKEDGGECQRVYSLVMTDGYWTETSFSLSQPDPDKDGHGNTLADVAITYFLTDLRPDLKDLLFPLECDTGLHQHMVTFTLSFGLSGTLNPSDYTRDEAPCRLETGSTTHRPGSTLTAETAKPKLTTSGTPRPTPSVRFSAPRTRKLWRPPSATFSVGSRTWIPPHRTSRRPRNRFSRARHFSRHFTTAQTGAETWRPEEFSTTPTARAPSYHPSPCGVPEKNSGNDLQKAGTSSDTTGKEPSPSPGMS